MPSIPIPVRSPGRIAPLPATKSVAAWAVAPPSGKRSRRSPPATRASRNSTCDASSCCISSSDSLASYNLRAPGDAHWECRSKSPPRKGTPLLRRKGRASGNGPYSAARRGKVPAPSAQKAAPPSDGPYSASRRYELFQFSHSHTPRPMIHSLSDAVSHESSCVKSVTCCRYGIGERERSVPQKRRCGPNAS